MGLPLTWKIRDSHGKFKELRRSEIVKRKSRYFVGGQETAAISMCYQTVQLLL